MNQTTKPKVLIVYFTYTKQSGRVTDAIAKQLEARGCDVTKAMIEFTDQRYVPKLFSQFPLKHPISQVSTMLIPQLRHRTGEIRIPAEAQSGDYDLVVIVSPTWWIQTVNADPLVPRFTGREGDPRRQAVRNGVDLAPLLRLQPPSAAKARREERRTVQQTRRTSWLPVDRSSP